MIRSFTPLLLIAGLLFLLLACNEPYTSKKRGYFKIDFPERRYRSFDTPGFPYSFEYPTYASIVQDSTYFDSTPENPYWINVDMDRFHGRIFLSYKAIGGRVVFKVKGADGQYHDSIGTNQFDNLVGDAFTLTSKNEFIASSIHDSLFVNPNGVTGILFRVGGNAATPLQFFMTDTAHHFLRGALYFEATPNADSLRPVVDFVKEDIYHMIRSFRWKSS